jgi:hypothetical protein
MKPRGLLPVVLLLCVLNIASLFTLDSADPDYNFNRAFAYATTPLFFIVIWCLWNGRNWARITMLGISGVSLAGVLLWSEFTLAEQISTVTWAVMGAFLLYWLNTKPIKEYFKPTPPETPYDANRPPIPEP